MSARCQDWISRQRLPNSAGPFIELRPADSQDFVSRLINALIEALQEFLSRRASDQAKIKAPTRPGVYSPSGLLLDILVVHYPLCQATDYQPGYVDAALSHEAFRLERRALSRARHVRGDTASASSAGLRDGVSINE